MKRIKIASVLAASIILITSCSKKPDIEYTSTAAMAGEWFIELRIDGAPIDDFTKITTYNTSDPNSGQIWFDDLAYWPLKAKLPIDYGTLSFKAATDIPNVSDDSHATPGETVRIVEGKILPNAAHSKSGNIVDSIYIKMEFSTDPGTEYEYSGHQRTGFFEDEY